MAVQDAQAEARLHDETLTELGLTEQPFLEDKKRQRFTDSTTQKTRAALEQHVRFGDPLHLLIGENGAGKTVLLQQLLKHCKNSIKPFVAKGSADFRAEAFLYAVLNDLDKDAKAESISDYIDTLSPIFDQITEDQYSAVMIVDDAHLAPIEEIAELIDILQNFENEDGRTARLLLTGTPALKQSIASFEAQFEDLDLKYSTNLIPPLDDGRTREYLSSRLHQAGFADAFPFTDKAIGKIQRESGGLPGKINDNATHYLNGVYRGGSAVAEGKTGWLSSLEWPVLAVGAAALAAIGLGLSMFFGDKSDTQVVPVASTETIEITEQPVVATTSGDSGSQGQIIAPAAETAVTNTDLLVQPTTGVATDTTATTIASKSNTSTDLVVEAPTPVLDTDTAETTANADPVADVIDTLGTANQDLNSTVSDAVASATDQTLGTVVSTVVEQPEDELPLATVEQPLVVSAPQAESTDEIAAAKAVGATPESVAVALPENATSGDLSNNTQLAGTTQLNTTLAEQASLGTAQEGVVVSTPTDNASVLLQGDTDAAAVAPQDQSVEISVATDVGANGVTIEEPNRAIENERWVLFQSPTKFTVQLATSRERGYIIDLAQSMEVQDPVAIYPFLTTNSNNPVFGLLSGLYDTRAEAIAAVENMSEDSKQFGVWIRPVSDLQDDIKRRN